ARPPDTMFASARLWGGLLIFVATFMAGCLNPPARDADGGKRGPRETTPTTLVVAFRYESLDLSPKIPEAIAGGAKALFNAFLTDKDAGNVSQPFLAESLPQLDTDTWRVFPDGQMQTT